MTQRRGNKRKTRRRQTSRNGNAFSRQLLDTQRTQERSLLPQIRDIQKMMLPRERMIMFERSLSAGTITTSASSPVFGSLRFSLDQLPAYAEFTNLFDAYRIIQVTVTFIPTMGMPNGTTSSSLYTVIDYDDDANLTSLNDALQYPSMQQSLPGSIIERTLSPSAASAAFSGVFTSFARMPKSTWVDATSPGVRYYGLKYAIDTNTTAVTLWTVTVRYVFQVKNVR